MAIEKLYSEGMAEWYDEICCDKDITKKQVKFLDKIFKKNKVKSVLDIGCGTGRISIELKKLNYNISGIDLEPAMINYAKRISKLENLKINFKVQDMRNINLNKKFDAAIIFFTSFSYLDSNDEVIKSLKSINKYLKKDGILIIETVFGWPIIIGGEFKEKVGYKIKKGDKFYQMADEYSLDFMNNYMYVKQAHIRKIGSKKLKVLKDKKPTKIRLYFPNELDLLFRLSGFKTINFLGNITYSKLSENCHKRLVAIAKKI